MRLRDTLAILTCSVFSMACQERRQASAASPVDTLALGQAREAAAALGGDLMTMLTRELARGGPVAAIAVCADSAQERTRRHQQAGVDVRRVGTRVRNPSNAPDAVETAVLTAFAAELTAGRMPEDTFFLEPLPAGGRELRYLRPIRVQEPCLACHGPASALAPGVRTLLAARYPMDRATDYAVGDLRGAISVRLTLPSHPGNGP
jgi:hypothetical protein